MSIASATTEVLYPDSDGQPMSDNTLQFEWIVTLQGNLDTLYLDSPDVFVAGDLLWYPVEGNNRIRAAPDTLVAFGRPKGYRGSYMQWREDDIAPQVVFEVLSPGNRVGEMTRKFQFYERYGVEEYYLIDPDESAIDGWQRRGDQLVSIEEMNAWVSPRMSIRFEVADDFLRIHRPDDSPFLTFLEISAAHEQEAQRANAEAERANVESERANVESERANAESERANVESERANAEAERADRLAERLRKLGHDPDSNS